MAQILFSGHLSMMLTWILCLILFFVPAVHSQGANDRTIDGRPACERCAVQLAPLLTLASSSFTADIDAFSALAVDSKRRYLVTASHGTTVLVFNATGQYLTHFGRAGAGPGEFTNVSQIEIGPGDSVYLLDSRHVMHVYSPSGQWARDIRMPGSVEAFFPLAAGLLARVNVKSPSAIGYPAHVLSPTGDIVKSFGIVGNPRFDPRCTSCFDYRLIGLSRDTAWLARPGEYTIERWLPAGRQDVIRVIKSPWFRTASNPNWFGGTVPRSSVIERGFTLSPSSLLVIGYAAPLDWKPHPPPAASGVHVDASGGVWSKDRVAFDDWLFETIDRNTSTIVEQIDLSSARTISSTRFAGELRFLSASLAYRKVRDADGVISYQLYSVRSTNP